MLSLLALVYFKARAEKAATPSFQQQQTEADERLLRQLVRPDMTPQEAEAVPTYSDFARLLRNGVIKILESRENLRLSMRTNTDLLDRYPPDGVPIRHRKAYVAQNSAWKVATLRSINEQTRAVKALRGDLYAYFVSHPEDYDRIGKRFEALIAEAIQSLRPGPEIVQQYAAARNALAPGPTTVKRARYAQAALAYESWKRTQ